MKTPRHAKQLRGQGWRFGFLVGALMLGVAACSGGGAKIQGSGGDTGSGGDGDPAGSGGAGGEGSGSGGGGGSASGGASATAGAGGGGRGGSAGSGRGGAVGSGGAPIGGFGGTVTCGETNKAAAFNGTDGVVTATLGNDLPIGDKSRTVELWVYTRSTTWKSDMNALFEYGNLNAANGGRGVFGIDFGGYSDARGNIKVYFGDPSYDYFFNAGLGTAPYVGWFHLAVIYDTASKTVRAVVNGAVPAGGEKMLTGAQSLQTQSDLVNIGRSRFYPDITTSESPSYFDGYVDDVRIWNVARSPEEIKTFMNRRLSGKEAGLVAYWHFDEGTGTTVVDVAKAHTATLSGGVTWTNSALSLICLQ